jgi:hypothetical protein
MEKVYLHIGTMKTATTFLQEEVFPKLNDTLFLPRDYITFNHSFEKLKFADDTFYDEEEIKKEFNKFKDKKVLISNEILSGSFLKNSINRTFIAKRLKKLFPNATIILTIRGQFDAMESFYKYMVHSQGCHQAIDQFFRYPLDNSVSYQFEDIHKKDHDKSKYKLYYMNKVHTDNFNYFEIIKLYKELFENVEVYLYEDFVKKPKQIINSLEELLEDKFNNKDDIDFNRKHRKGITDNQLKHYLFANKLRILTKNKALFYFLVNLHALTNRKTISTKPFFNKIQECFKENNNLIIENYPEIGIQNYPEKYQF